MFWTFTCGERQSKRFTETNHNLCKTYVITSYTKLKPLPKRKFIECSKTWNVELTFVFTNLVGISSSCCDSIFVIFNKLRDGHCSSHKIDNSKYFVIDFSNTGYRSCFKIPGAQLLFERTVESGLPRSLYVKKTTWLFWCQISNRLHKVCLRVKTTWCYVNWLFMSAVFIYNHIPLKTLIC